MKARYCDRCGWATASPVTGPCTKCGRFALTGDRGLVRVLVALCLLGTPTALAALALGASGFVAIGLASWPMWIARVWQDKSREHIEPTCFDERRLHHVHTMSRCVEIIHRAGERMTRLCAMSQQTNAQTHTALDHETIETAITEHERQAGQLFSLRTSWVNEQMELLRAAAASCHMRPWPREVAARMSEEIAGWNDDGVGFPYELALRVFELELDLTDGVARVRDLDLVLRAATLEIPLPTGHFDPLDEARKRLDLLGAYNTLNEELSS
ncbi:MAG: hypothetical protein AB7P00_20355 [Sandaracinaceae bacterium]